MSRQGRFGWGLVLGAAAGFVAGAYLGSGPGRGQVETVRSRTIELTGRGDELRARAREAAERARGLVADPEGTIGKAFQEGLSAARRRRGELELGDTPRPASDGSPGPGGGGA